jgi:hypothetical protein
MNMGERGVDALQIDHRPNLGMTPADSKVGGAKLAVQHHHAFSTMVQIALVKATATCVIQRAA